MSKVSKADIQKRQMLLYKFLGSLTPEKLKKSTYSLYREYANSLEDTNCVMNSRTFTAAFEAHGYEFVGERKGRSSSNPVSSSKLDDLERGIKLIQAQVAQLVSGVKDLSESHESIRKQILSVQQQIATLNKSDVLL
jgi:peptidoglycan hydrolase CwlO-like protein